MALINPRNTSMVTFGAATWTIFLAVQGQYLNDYIADLPEYTPLLITLMVSLVAVASAIAGLLAGAISDTLISRFGRRRPFILIGGVISSLFFLFIPLTTLIPLIIAMNVIMALFNSAGYVTNHSFIPDIAPSDQRGRMNGFKSIGNTIGFVGGYGIIAL
ncbi:MAG: MFS transporter, partial [Promethearchaeota archaeon]